MKNILRNNLWMVIVAWCLELQGHYVYGIIVSLLASVYLLINIKNINVLKVGIIFLGFSIYCYLIGSVTVNELYKMFVPFMLTLMMNVSLTNERLKKERLINLYNIFVFCLTCFILFFLAILFIPSFLVNEIGRVNMLSLVMIIFMPYSSIMLVSVIRKEYNKKLLLDKLERQTRDKMFDIKA